MDDPVVQAIHKLLDHAAATEERFNRLVALLQHEGMDCGEAKAVADAFDPRPNQQDAGVNFSAL